MLRNIKEEGTNNRRKLHGDVIFWLYTLCGWSAITITLIHFEDFTDTVMAIVGALIWLFVNVYTSQKRHEIEAGGKFDSNMYQKFSKVKEMEDELERQ